MSQLRKSSSTVSQYFQAVIDTAFQAVARLCPKLCPPRSVGSVGFSHDDLDTKNPAWVREGLGGRRDQCIKLGAEVAFADVLGLEAVRIFLPDVFARLHGAVDVLTEATT
jgi:hypothetical protein